MSWILHANTNCCNTVHVLPKTPHELDFILQSTQAPDQWAKPPTKGIDSATPPLPQTISISDINSNSPSSNLPGGQLYTAAASKISLSSLPHSIATPTPPHPSVAPHSSTFPSPIPNDKACSLPSRARPFKQAKKCKVDRSRRRFVGWVRKKFRLQAPWSAGALHSDMAWEKAVRRADGQGL